MTNLPTFGKRFCPGKLLTGLILLACFSGRALPANQITGSVRNQSRGGPAADDEVILIRLDKAMQEEARAKTDAQGAFALSVQYADKPYLVRVMHQGVSYDQQASTGQALSIQVFDAARRVRGVTGNIEILRVVTNGSLLHVSDLIDIKNESSPPLTQAGERTFEVFLPATAKLDSVLAAGPGKTAFTISAALVPGEPGHYTVNFPLRPGATKFAFNYDLPYDGHAVFQTRQAYPLQQLAIMIPPTMKFSSRSPAFQLLPTGNAPYQVEAANRLSAGKGPGFEVSGTGTLPSIGELAASQARSDSLAPPNPEVHTPVHNPVHSVLTPSPRAEPALPRPPSFSQSFVLAGLAAILFAVSALLIWRARKTHRAPRTGNLRL